MEELLAALEANIPVARGSRWSAERSSHAAWLVMDGDCAERVRGAATALRQSASMDGTTSEAMGCPSSDAEHCSSREALVQELLAAIEANKPFATGTGHCPDVPCFDRFDYEVESSRPGWEQVDGDRAKRVEKAAAALREQVTGNR